MYTRYRFIALLLSQPLSNQLWKKEKRIAFDVILNLIQKDNMQIKSEPFIYLYTQSKHLPITLSGGKTCMSNSK